MVIIFLALHSVATAETWTSPDGFLSVEVPDATRFEQQPKPREPALVQWMSLDKTAHLAVVAVPFPPHSLIRQSDVEAGFAHGMKATSVVTRLPTTTVSGHEVWGMSAKFAGGIGQQALIVHRGTAYSLVGSATADDPEATGFNTLLASLALHEPPSPFGNGRGAPTDPNAVNKLAYGIGAVFGVCLVLVWFFIHRSRSVITKDE